MSEWDTSKEAFIQWKGTDVCMELHCPKCGWHNHYDGYFAYAVECAKCKAIWKLNCFVTFRAADPAIEDDAYSIEHPLRDKDGYDPECDDDEPDAGVEQP